MNCEQKFSRTLIACSLTIICVSNHVQSDEKYAMSEVVAKSAEIGLV